MHARILACAILAASGAALAQVPAEWGAAESAASDFEDALRMWQRGLYGVLLFYHDGNGPLGPRLYADMDAPKTQAVARPEEWEVTAIDCPSDNTCYATALIRFTDEPTAGLRRYWLVRDPGQLWGLYSEDMLECPAGYRLQYQGACLNTADERSDDPDIEVRTADPVVAD